MADIARHAGVSISTVSRVINGTATVDPATEARVREAIDELGYRPNLLARSFRRRETQTIGLLVPDNSNPFFAELARVIEDVGFAEHYNLVLCNSDLSEEKQSHYIDVLLDKRVDGMILTSTGLIDDTSGTDAVRRIRDAGVPFVVIDRDLGEGVADQVLVDNHLGGQQAGNHLIELGHRRIACIVGPSDLTPSAGRIAGFNGALDSAGLTLAEELVVQGNGRHDGAVAATRELLRRSTDFSAIFVFNDVMATSVVGFLQRAGRRVPEDISVVGFDDIPIASSIYPSLTTIAQPIADMGRLGIELLLRRIRDPGASYERIVLPTRLIPRESTKASSHRKGGATRP